MNFNKIKTKIENKIQDSRFFREFNTYLFFISIPIISYSIIRLFLYRWRYTFHIKGAYKDEGGFLDSFLKLKEKGWYNSVSEGCSPLFNGATWLINFFIPDPVYAMRALSLLSMLVLISLWITLIFKFTSLPGRIKWVVSLFLISAVLMRGAYFTATDDPLFILFITISFLCLYMGVSNEVKRNVFFAISGLAYACALSTRGLFIFYALGFFIIFFILLFFSVNYFRALLFFLFFFLLTVFVIHYPSLLEKRKLSFHNKDYNERNVTWPEINYLFLLRNKDRLLLGRDNKIKPLPEEVTAYKKLHGDDSLPETYRESIMMLPLKMHVQNFLGLFYLHLLPFIRQLGLLYLFFIGISLAFLVKRKNDYLQSIPFLFYLCFAISLCLIPVVHLEFRWFMAFVPLIIFFSVFYMDKYVQKYSQLAYTLLFLNVIFIATLNALLLGVW